MIANPVNLFAEYAALNSGFCTVEPGGYFTYVTNSGSDPLTLCVSATGASGSFAPQVLSLNEPIISVGTSTPFVDFSGDECGGAGAFGGSFVVFAYNLPAANGCAAQSKAFSVWLVNNQVSLTRTDEACMYEAFGDNPVDQSDNAPDVQAYANYITPVYTVKLKVEQRSVDASLNECSGPDVLVYDQLQTVGQDIATYTANTSFLGPRLTHSIEATDLINIGGQIKQVKIAGVGMVNVDIVRTGTMGTFVADVRDKINAVLAGNKYQLSVTNASNRLRITMTCANGSPWVGIDKTDGYLSWCTGADCMTTFGSTTTVTQTVSGSFEKGFFPYTTPCGDNLQVYTSLCPDRADLEIIDVAASNYNVLGLINVSGRRYYIYDKADPSEGVGRQAICHTVAVTISGSGCSVPPGPAVYSWQGGGVNPKIFTPLQEDTAESDCGGCISPGVDFCYPEARSTGHIFGISSLACNTGSSTTLTQLIAPDITDCDGNDGYAMTLSALTVHDVPAAFTSCTPNAALRVIQSVHPADILPRTYYYAYQFQEPGTERSNYALVRVDITIGNCCT